VVIKKVAPGSLAAFAGLQAEEVITNSNGRTIGNPEQFKKELDNHKLMERIWLQTKSEKGSRFVSPKDGTKQCAISVGKPVKSTHFASSNICSSRSDLSPRPRLTRKQT